MQVSLLFIFLIYISSFDQILFAHAFPSTGRCVNAAKAYHQPLWRGRFNSQIRGVIGGGEEEEATKAPKKEIKDNLQGADIGELFSKIQDMDPNDVPPEIRDEIMKKIREEAPSDTEMRMRIMGITPLTKVGFALTGVLLLLNVVLGNGWAGNLLGLSEDNKYNNDEIEMAARLAAQKSFLKSVPSDFEVPSEIEIPKDYLMKYGDPRE